MPRTPVAARRGLRTCITLTAAAGGIAGLLITADPAMAAPAPIPLTSSQCPTDIQQGENDGCVTELQDLLNSKGGAGLTVDGDFGPSTLTAVKNWQSGHGLSVDGVVGPNTKSSLDNAGTGGGGGGAAAAGSAAAANANHTACGTNSAGGKGYYTSCTGNGGQPEYWCADFAKWAWAQGGLNVSGLTAAAGSFYTYGSNHGTLHTGAYTPKVGDVIVYGYQGNGVAGHDGIVSSINSDGSLVTQNGDFSGQSGSEATFASTSKVVTATIAASQRGVGSRPSSIGQTISAYVTPVS